MRSLSEKVGRLFMIGIPGPVLDDETKHLLEEIDPLSIIFFGRNIVSCDQLAALIRDITSFLGRKPVFAIDQEGGLVTRLGQDFTVLPGPMALTATGDPENAYTAGSILGQEMKGLGIDWNLAPVVDVNRNHGNRGIGVRSFSGITDEVNRYAGRFISGLTDAGVLPCLKHFPGLGGVEADPHLELPVLNCSRDEIFKHDLPPFFALKADCWMPTHIYIPALQSRREAVTVSTEILTDFVRGELGFEGLLLADDLNMGGVSNSAPIEETVINTFNAGMDVLSIAEGSGGQIRAKNALRKAVRESESLQKRVGESLSRIERVLSPYQGELFQDPGLLNRPENRAKARDISLKTVRCLKQAVPVPPPEKIDNVFAMRPSRLVLVEQEKDGMPEAARMIAEEAGCSLLEIERTPSPDAGFAGLLGKAEGGINLVFTENAYLEPELAGFVSKLAEVSGSLHLIALRNPWDADIPGVENAICSYGYTQDQMSAIYRMLTVGVLPG